MGRQLAELPHDITRMLDSGRIERVAVNRTHAKAVLETAQLHLRTAATVADTDDVAMAFTAAYDGARKALVAVLAAYGLRARPVGGAHRNTGLVAAALMPGAASTIADFDWMRQIRNTTEYPEDARPVATREDVREAIAAGRSIVAACENALDSKERE